MIDIAVSVLTVPKENAVSVFYNLETAKINYFHIDVMDGKFVENNNLDLMKDYALTISHISNTGLDIHLMVNDVEMVMDDYISLEPQIISFHYEAIKEKDRIIDIINDIKSNGIKVGMAINPETSIDQIKEYLPFIHQVIVMTVVPGKGGQSLISKTLDKIKELKKYLIDNELDNVEIEADGGINDVNAQEVAQSGADILVSGTYVINSDNYSESVKKLRKEE